jgi:hypothetical protein
MLKAATEKPGETAAPRERPCKRHFTTGYSRDRDNAVMEVLWEWLFPCVSLRRCHIPTKHLHEEMFSVESALRLLNENCKSNFALMYTS